MKNIERRVQRIEALVTEEEGLTADDALLVLSVLPKEYADAVFSEYPRYTKCFVSTIDDRPQY